MSSTINKIINEIVYRENYPTHQDIVRWAKDSNEYEAIIKAMHTEKLCTIQDKETRVYQQQFYESPVYGGTGQTVTMEAPSTLRSINQERIIHIHNYASSAFSQIIEQRYSSTIAERRLIRDQNEKELSQRHQEESQKRSEQNRRCELERETREMEQRKKSPPIHFYSIPKLSHAQYRETEQKLNARINILRSQTDAEFKGKLKDAYEKNLISPQEFSVFLPKDWESKKEEKRKQAETSRLIQQDFNNDGVGEVIDPFLFR